MTALVQELNGRIPEIRPLLNGAAREGFRAQFGGTTSVVLHKVTYSFEDSPEDGPQFRANITLDYGTFLASASMSWKLRGKSKNPGATLSQEVALQKVCVKVRDWMRIAFHELPKSCTLTGDGCCSSRAFQRILVKKVGNGSSLGAFLQDSAEKLRPTLEENVLMKVREDLARRQKIAFSSPAPWLCPCRVESCHLNLSSSDMALAVDCTVEVAYLETHPEVASKVGSDVLRKAFSLKMRDLKSQVRGEWLTMAVSAGEEILKTLVPYQIIPPQGEQAGNGFPPELWNLLSLGHAETGLFSMNLDLGIGKKALAKDGMFLALTGPEKAVFVSPLQADGQRFPPFRLGLLNSAAGADPLSEAFPPDSLAGTLRVLKAGAELYDQADFGSLPKPRIHVEICRDGVTGIAYGRESISVDQDGRRVLGERPKEWLEELIGRVRTYAREFSQEDEAVSRALGTLNPTALAVLQYIYGEKNVGLWDLFLFLAPTLPVEEDDFLYFLNQARQAEAPVDGNLQHLVDLDSPTFPALRQIILDAHPGEYRAEDLPNLTSAGRLQALEEMARVAKTRKAQRNLLEILIKGLSWGEHASFLKTKAGQAFLRGLEGDDREHARRLLKDLHGCSRLVESLLGPVRTAGQDGVPSAE